MLGTLCPWCMVTWLVTIPTVYAVTLHVLRNGRAGAGGDATARRRLMGWVPLFAVLSYAIIAILAQLRLDVLGNLF